MQTLTFTNSRGTLSFGNTDPYWLQTVSGISGLGASIESQKAPFQDGSTFINSQYNNRNITMKVHMKAVDYDALNALKIEIQRIFARDITNTLTYNNETYEKEIEVQVENAPVFSQVKSEKDRTYQSFFVSLIAHQPFWLDTTTTGETLSIFAPLFEFDLELTDEYEFETDLGNRITIDNQGHVETPVLITFTGPATNPRIDNETTGEYIAVTKTLAVGESLIINTEFGNISVLFDDGATQTNAFGLIDLNSEFWRLQTGENTISYSADAGVTTANVLVQYKERFIGL